MPTVIFGLPWDIDTVGGVSEVVRGLLRASLESGSIRPLLFVPEYGARQARFEMATVDGTQAIERLTLRVVDPFSSEAPPLVRLVAIAQWPLNVLRIARALRQIQPDALNVHYPGLWCLTLAAGLRLAGTRTRLTLSFHGADIAVIESGSRLERALWRRLARSADALTTCSASLRARLHAALGHVEHPGSVAILNGLDPRFIDAAVASASFPLPSTRHPYVVNVGTYEHKKGQDVLVRAFACLRRTHPDLRLAILGRDGPALPPLRELVRELGVEDAVDLLVDVPHGAALAAIRGAAAFALSSRREPFGLVLLEAAHFGVPIVATRVDGVPEIVTHDASGLLVPSDDPDALANGIAQLLDEPARARRLADTARVAIAERFGFAATFRGYRSALLAESDVRAAVAVPGARGS